MIKSLQQARVAREKLAEEKARHLLYRYWRQEQARLGRNIDPANLLPIDVAAIARNTLSIDVLDSWNVSSDLTSPSSRTNLAGFVDGRRRKIVVARELPSEVKRFTIAHEIGHLLMHPNRLQFREDPRTDIALRGGQKSPLEYQADSFAGFLTIPRKIVTDKYERMFGIPIDGAKLTENQAYAVLGEKGILSVIANLSALDLAKLVAEAISLVYGEPRTLSEVFGVSSTAMGIQLLRVGLVRVGEREMEWA